MHLTLWDGDQEVIDSEGYRIFVDPIPEGEPAHKANLQLKCIYKKENLAIFKDINGRVYYYQLRTVNGLNRIMRTISKGGTYNLSCSVIDIPDGVAANGLTYAFKCSWIIRVNVTKDMKAKLEEIDRADRQLMMDLYGPNRREFFDNDLLK